MLYQHTTAEITAPSLESVPATEALYVRSLSLYAFRNYTELHLDATVRPVVLTGYNGAGKTNILEAISLLSPGRGLRKARLFEMDNQHIPGSNWTIAAQINGMQGNIQVGTGRDPESTTESDRRLVKIDGKLARAHSDLGRHTAIVWLTPQLEQLFHEGASAGRKFLDRLVYSFDPEHASRVNEYEFAMRERNKLLQNFQPDANWLDALEQTMAENAAAIASARLSTLSSINHAIGVSKLSFPKAWLDISGYAERRLLEDGAAVNVEKELKNLWENNRRDDAISGRTGQGVHRSELQVTHMEKSMPAEACSTGEQKALLLSIILAQARASALWKRVIPMVLLDEVITHLDARRKLELFEEICQIGAQFWMTGTDASHFADLSGKASFFQLENGRLLNV